MARRAASSSTGEIFVARESFFCNIDGVDYHVQGGSTRVRAGHKLLEGREQLFMPLTVDYDLDSPQRASAAPPHDEKRED